MCEVSDFFFFQNNDLSSRGNLNQNFRNFKFESDFYSPFFEQNQKNRKFRTFIYLELQLSQFSAKSGTKKFFTSLHFTSLHFTSLTSLTHFTHFTTSASRRVRRKKGVDTARQVKLEAVRPHVGKAWVGLARFARSPLYFKSATSFSFENYKRKSFKKRTVKFVKISTK